jgi:hypothetical protein
MKNETMNTDASKSQAKVAAKSDVKEKEDCAAKDLSRNIMMGTKHKIEEEHSHSLAGHPQPHLQSNEFKKHAGHGHNGEPSRAKDSVSPASIKQSITIYIDQKPYAIAAPKISGAELRQLAHPPIPANLDVFHAISGNHADVSLSDNDVVDIDIHELKHGRHFYSAIARRSLTNEEASDVEKQAYFIFLEQGAGHGHDVAHWLEAEQRYRSRRDRK